MYSKILDQKTYRAVVQAAPGVPGEYDRIALEIINFLALQQKDGESVTCSCSISGIAQELAAFEVSPALVGRIVGELGLLKVRRRDGYHVYYSAKQMMLLRYAFKFKELAWNS